MVKKARSDAENQNTNGGCNCPIQNGCRVRQPIDPLNPPTDAVKVVCSSGDKCKQIPYVHSQCFDSWSESLLRDYKALGNRARNDARMDRYYAVNPDHIWHSHAYGKLSRFCKCPCGGTLRKHFGLDVKAPGTVNIHLGAAAVVYQTVTKKAKKPPLVMNKKFKGPSKKAYGTLVGPSGFSNKQSQRNNRLNHNIDDFVGSENNDEKYIPPGLYSGGNQKCDGLFPKVDNSISVIGQKSTKKPAVKRPSIEKINKISSTKSIDTEDELLDELNVLFGQVPDDISQDQLTQLVNAVLDRTDVYILSTIADVGDVWEWLRQKADEDEEDSNEEDNADESGEEAEVVESNNDDEPTFTVEEPPPLAVRPRVAAAAFVRDELGINVGMSAAFCYRDSIAHVESLMKSMNLMPKNKI